MIKFLSINKKPLVLAVSTILGTASGAVVADSIDMTFSGVFTLIRNTEDSFRNPDTPADNWYERRSDINGTMSFDLDTLTGTGNILPFSFGGSGASAFTNINFTAIGNGFGGPGSLMLGNMIFDFSAGAFPNLPVSIVMDAAGLFGALTAGGTTGPDVNNVSVSQNITGGALSATDGMLFPFGRNSYTLPIGAGPMVTTTWDTIDLGSGTGGTIQLGDNPSGQLPLIADTVGGSPMAIGPLANWNVNLDLTNLHVNAINISPVPVPAAVWLFGSGLLGLVSVARRKKMT